uniref:SPIN90/Ldb17 leucine-rich domain-containing protein n=1 Tax=Globisporangium ultimum (strain ATCC 200006 / CBS 805.95 / DAOM BR144) TaxID=431595 RepID=K3WR26_GLOUD
MVLRGVIDSPPDQSAALRELDAIEKTLRALDSSGGFGAAAQYERVRDALWELLLDAVCSPLWVRVRAAELLNVCFTVRRELLRVERRNAYWIRSIVSSTCQVLEDCDATERAQAQSLFKWLAFLDNMLLATPSDVFAKVFRHSMYAGMLTKMLRLLSNCSTKVFAATTMCIASFYAHERRVFDQSEVTGDSKQQQPQIKSVLVDQVLAEHREGMQYFGGALLHVINSCGYPCPENRVVHLWNSLQLFGDILAHPQASELVFVNDFKIVIDILIRECSDLPPDDMTRCEYLTLFDRVLGSPLFLRAHLYRKKEILRLLEALLATGAEEDSPLPPHAVTQINELLIQYIDRLD